MSERSKRLVILSLVLVVLRVLFFTSGSFFILYVLFETTLFPLLVILLGFGAQVQKIRSAYFLTIYTVITSMPFLYVYLLVELFSLYCDLLLHSFILFILTVGFLIKFPVYFLHLWLPKVHVEAPASASVLLAGLLLKLGTYGFCRFLGSIV